MKGFLYILLGAFLALAAVGALGGNQASKQPVGQRLPSSGGANTSGVLQEGACFPILADDDDGRASAKQDVEIWDLDGDCELGPDEYQDTMAFAAADRDGSGTVSLNEHHFLTIIEYLDSNADDKISVGELAVVLPGDAAMFVSLADADLDGNLSFAEFEVLAGDGRAARDESDEFAAALRMEETAFAADTNGDGTLSASEIPAWSRLSHLDANGDGALTRREYRSRWLELVTAEPLAKFRQADKDGDGSVPAADWPDDKEGFYLMDANHNGAVTEAELTAFMGRFLGALGELPEMGMFILLDADDSNDLSYAEMPPGEAQDGFVFLDLDLDGLVTFAEAEPILVLFARTEALGEGRLAAHFEAMDSDHDGVLGLEELGLDEETFHALDKDGGGGVSLEEMTAFEAHAAAGMG